MLADWQEIRGEVWAEAIRKDVTSRLACVIRSGAERSRPSLATTLSKMERSDILDNVSVYLKFRTLLIKIQ